MTVLSPLRYPGGKDKTYNYVKRLVEINNISTYIEPFAGGAAVAFRLLLNNDVKRVIINDYDLSIYSFWYAVVFKTEDLILLIEQTPITIEEWHKQKAIQENKENVSLISLAFSTLFLNRTNRSGIIKAGVIGGKDQTGEYKLDCRFNKEKIIEKIENIAKQKKRIEIYNMDAKDFIFKVIKKTRKSLTFFDPPYYDKGPDLYTNFYSHENHVELANIIHKAMRNRYWILTYDIAEQIEFLYRKNRKEKYYLNYSVAKPTKGQEFMFFSRKVNPDSIEDFLTLVPTSQ